MNAWLARWRVATTRTTTTLLGRRPHLAPVAISALRVHLRRSSWRSGCRAARGPMRFGGSSAGATSTSRCCYITRVTLDRSSNSASAAPSSGATRRGPSTRWAEGRTGFPLVDAGMRQLLREGWMHNRARLVVGSFLTKDLGIDWRWGERHFMRYLLDGDEASNNGNWQWIASVGHRSPARVPAHLQPRPPHGALRPRRQLRAPLRARAEPACPASIWPSRGRCPREVQRDACCVIGERLPCAHGGPQGSP